MYMEFRHFIDFLLVFYSPGHGWGRVEKRVRLVRTKKKSPKTGRESARTHVLGVKFDGESIAIIIFA